MTMSRTTCAATALWVSIALLSRSAALADESSTLRTAAVERALAAVHKLGPERRDALDRAIYEASRARCHGDTATPATGCLIEAATAICAGDVDCLAASDVVVTNLRSTTFFVDDLTRARLVRSSTDYHAALAAELRHRYAALASELAITGRAIGSGATDQPGATAAPTDRPGATNRSPSSSGSADHPGETNGAPTSGTTPPPTSRSAAGTGDVTGASIDAFCRVRDRVVHACAPNDVACVPSVPWSRCVAAIIWFVGGTP